MDIPSENMILSQNLLPVLFSVSHTSLIKAALGRLDYGR